MKAKRLILVLSAVLSMSCAIANAQTTPPKGSALRQAIMDGIRLGDFYKTEKEAKENRENILFVVHYVKVGGGKRHPNSGRQGLRRTALGTPQRNWQQMGRPGLS